MALRSMRLRVLQSLLYEFGGIVLATPIYAAVFGTSQAESGGLMVALAVAVLAWAPLYNLVYDRVEWHRTRRLASDRPPLQRLLHVVLLETTVLVLTMPILMVLGGHNWSNALMIDFGLTLAYAAYGIVFFKLFDLVLPMQPQGAQP